MKFTDTHCHIHEADYLDAEVAYERAKMTGVERLVCVGTDKKSSVAAVEFAKSHDGVWASVGLHPHDAKSGLAAITKIENLILTEALTHKIVAIGECGLDYFYNNSPRDQQIAVLHAQMELAEKHNLAVIFHVRQAFADFWPILAEHKINHAVLHSFTDDLINLEKAVGKGLFIGVNGIATFAHDKRDVYTAIPLENLVLETDSPFLTPVPYRGRVNEPAFVSLVAEYIANLQSIDLTELSEATERNATKLFLNKN